MVTQPLTRNLLLRLFQNSLSVVESHPTIVAERPVQGIQEVYRYAILPLSHGAGWSSSVARRAHNPKVTGSNPVPATIESPVTSGALLLGSNGLEVVLPTRCPQESVQIHSVRSLPVLLRLPLARDGVVSEASSRYSFAADSGGGGGVVRCPPGNLRNCATVRGSSGNEHRPRHGSLAFVRSWESMWVVGVNWVVRLPALRSHRAPVRARLLCPVVHVFVHPRLFWSGKRGRCIVACRPEKSVRGR